MTVTLHPRETGATIRCNYRGCKNAVTTGQILIGPIRAYTKTVGWIRGLDPGSGSPDEGGRPSNRRWDICPAHAVEERRKHDERTAAGKAIKARRDELRKMTPEERIAEKRRVRNEAAAKRRTAAKQAA